MTNGRNGEVGPPAFYVVVKPRGPSCNLACAYCYYLSKQALHPQGSCCMSDSVLESFTRQYIAAQHVPEVTFVWQGGEPLLMGLDFYNRALELQRQYRRPGMRIQNGIQTNGTLLDDDWCEFFRAHDFLVGVSLDGPQELHDTYRRDRRNRPTFERAMAGVRLLQEHAVDFNVLCCVHAANADHPLEVYRFLRDDVGTQFIQFIPIVERARSGGADEGQVGSDRSVGSRQYGDFLIAVFDEWVRRDVGSVFVQIFDETLAAWVGHPPALCVFSPTCGTALAMEHNGDLYSCDHYVEPRYLLGNVMQTPLKGLAWSPAQRQFGLAKLETLPVRCQQCDVRFVCHGGCPKNRVSHTVGGDAGLNHLCEGYQAFFRHIDRPMGMMAEELANARPPANIMQRLATEHVDLQRQVPRLPHDAPCPCGSGRNI